MLASVPAHSPPGHGLRPGHTPVCRLVCRDVRLHLAAVQKCTCQLDSAVSRGMNASKHMELFGHPPIRARPSSARVFRSGVVKDFHLSQDAVEDVK